MFCGRAGNKKFVAVRPLSVDWCGVQEFHGSALRRVDFPACARNRVRSTRQWFDTRSSSGRTSSQKFPRSTPSSTTVAVNMAPMPMRDSAVVAVLLVTASTLLNAGGQSSPPLHPQAEAQALNLARQAIALRSVKGPGNQTIKVAELFRDALVAGGFATSDSTITPVDDTAFMVARWHGSDRSLKPLVISGHLDVVEAKASDWQRDPFTPVVEHGYLYGRGASDMKFDAALALAAIIELKRDGFAPRRDIVIEFSGDEETDMKTSAMIAEQLKGADLVVNIDGGGGTLDETTGKPLYFTWQGAEKTYADFELTVTNPGGHSSQPRADSAISQLA